MSSGERWRLRKGDNVVVLSGKDKGKTGDIVKVLRTERRVVVSGVNFCFKHCKPSAKHPEGGKIKQEASIHASNVSLCDSAGKATRVGIKFLPNGEKVRFAKTSGEVIQGK